MRRLIALVFALAGCASDAGDLQPADRGEPCAKTACSSAGSGFRSSADEPVGVCDAAALEQPNDTPAHARRDLLDLGTRGRCDREKLELRHSLAVAAGRLKKAPSRKTAWMCGLEPRGWPSTPCSQAPVCKPTGAIIYTVRRAWSRA